MARMPRMPRWLADYPDPEFVLAKYNDLMDFKQSPDRQGDEFYPIY